MFMIPLAELPARPHQPHLDGTFGGLEEMCNVADTAVVEVAEIHHGLVFEVEQIECFFQDYDIKVLVEKSVKTGLLLLAMVRCFDFMNEDDLAFAPARNVHAMVVSNGEKPRGEFGAGLKSAHFMDQFKKDIVHNVFGPGSIPGKCDAFLVDLYSVALVKFLEVTIVP